VKTGDVLRIVGMPENAYNRQWRVKTPPVPITGSSASSASSASQSASQCR
jgi:hypothetical protein